MSWTVTLALYGWIPLVATLFALLPPSRAVLIAYFGGWMFLPIANLETFGFFDYQKSTAIPAVVFLCSIAFDGARWSRLRFTWPDLPVLAFCAVPLFSSLSNGLGWYDGLSSVMYQCVIWGLPYATGRAYFASLAGTKQVAVAMLAAGLVYAPLCLWEIRMSPQLHAIVYGFQQHDWVQVLRGGGYRPMVFMQHGLMVGLWMCAASLVAMALWMSGALRQLWGIPMYAVVAFLCGTTALCKSFGAIALLLAGVACLWVMRAARTSLPMALLVCVPAAYVAVRVSGYWSGEQLVQAVSKVSEDRASSLAYRIHSEESLRVRAAEKPLFGWGGWNRSITHRADDPDQATLVTIDSLWIILFGKNGYAGLVSVLLLFLVPVLMLWKHCSPGLWDGGGAVWPWTIALVLTLYALDGLANAMLNPVYLLMAGALCGLAPARHRVPARKTFVKQRARAFAGANAQ
ncbi:MAG TPA: O-antigen ligase domain-containing protein [Planctomycetota bacterium]|nr:O-antigen ligase domain-containing protein [Planctomycetota bacterium]